jgi:hypothetical protein
MYPTTATERLTRYAQWALHFAYQKALCSEVNRKQRVSLWLTVQE